MRLGFSVLFCALLMGCTAVVWDQRTFADHYRPANPVNLQLYHSPERQDILVRYDECKNASAIRPRYYWLEKNAVRINEGRKPHFVSIADTKHLVAVTVATSTNLTENSAKQLHAVAPRDGDSFILYSGNEKLDPYKLPDYTGGSQRVKQVMLTPFAVAIDATIVGAVVGYCCAPALLTSLNK